MDIVLLQETKIIKDKVEGLLVFKSGKVLGGDVDGASSGMEVFWNDRYISRELISHNRNMMNIRFSNAKDGTSWVLTNVYAPNSKWVRKALWDSLSNKRNNFLDENWITMGDFNTPLKENKKMGGSQTNLHSRLELMEFIDSHLLYDMDLHGVNYTWTNIRIGKDIIKVSLDRALISNDWFLKYKFSLSIHVRVVSDYYPIFLLSNAISIKKNYPFRFEKMWTLHLRLENLIKDWWGIHVKGKTIFKVVKNLINFKKNIKI